MFNIVTWVYGDWFTFSQSQVDIRVQVSAILGT